MIYLVSISLLGALFAFAWAIRSNKEKAQAQAEIERLESLVQYEKRQAIRAKCLFNLSNAELNRLKTRIKKLPAYELRKLGNIDLRLGKGFSKLNDNA